MINVPFETIYRDFENTNNVCGFSSKYSENDVATRFLLIRSLDKPNLIDILKKYSSEIAFGKLKDMTKQVYMSDVTITQLLEYIESQRNTILEVREKELNGISDILADFPIVNCGLRNDKVDDIVKYIVRNKSIKSIAELETAIDSSALPRIRQYILWSYYNQNSNDIIELFFLRHPKVIPTLRKIHNIDFFIKIENRIVPFDLKFTHISDEYFDLISEGIINRTNDTTFFDNYKTMGNLNELKQIKFFYSAHKKVWNLKNYGGLSKIELIQNLEETKEPEALDFINNITKKRKKYVTSTVENPQILEWWNYKYQGERLFCNNNRLFVFLAYSDRFIDGRPLKGRTKEIGKKIKELLDNLSFETIHNINYYYTKEANLAGNYTALSVSTIYTE